MKNIWGFLAMFILASFILIKSFSTFENEEYEGMEEDISMRLAWMQKMLADPKTNRIPENIREAELAFSMTLPSDAGLTKFANWSQIGPYNVGGRTRVVAMDISEPNNLIAGAATGGIWKSTNDGISWFPCQMNAVPTSNITSLVQDTRKGKTKNWYASTGELYGGNIPGAFINGSGVYKSNDGGYTWIKAGNVASGLGGLSGNWSVVFRLALNPSIDSLDVLFAANFDGIFRSNNAGLSWIKVRGGSTPINGYSYFTDVAVTSKGIVYATLSGGGLHQGIWRSANNGNSWTNITPADFQSTTGRISIGIAPSDENQVYFIANTPAKGKESKNFEGNSEWNSLWKYTYLSGDGSATGWQWEDRSSNIPAGVGGFSDFISQSGYCMEVDVKPDDPNTVFIGGTNLYRSMDGFKTNTKTTQIGGYGLATTLPDFKVYPNHHPDNHGVIFYPQDSKKVISFHDGGISRTNNCLASSVDWESLNHGYLTSQFYTIALDHESNSLLTLGGLQDNGTYLTTNAIATSNWTMPLSYDGAYAFIKPGGGEVYLSIQQGRMQRMQLDANGIPVKFTRIDPKGVNKADYQFINPFTPDANDFKKVYTAAGNVIWRNSDITAIPFKNQLDSNASDLNWTRLERTLLPVTGDEITAVLSSKNQPDVFYYGTAKGNLYRLRNTADTASVPVNIKGNNFPAGYINCIAQDPKDSLHLFAVFTNYYVLSIFETKDGGNAWEAVSGNLEQNSNGTGNGPSCRWLTIAPTQDSLLYFVGTSTGLYATKKLDGMQTVWVRQGATTIGTQIVTMMDHRVGDGRMVVSTYGSGVFQSYVNSLNPKTGTKEWSEKEFALFPNPASENIMLQNLPKNDGLSFEIHALNGELVMKGKTDASSSVNIAELKPGTYLFLLKDRFEGAHKLFIKQ